MTPPSKRFTFDGGAGNYLGTAILGTLITILTAGICYPFSIVLMQRWRASHSTIDGRRLAFNGTATGLFGLWIKWFLLTIITAGIYLFWVTPRLEQWKWEHTDFAAGPAAPYPGTPGAQVNINLT